MCLPLEPDNHLFASLIVPIVLYRSDIWTLKTENDSNLITFDMLYLCLIAKISFADRVINGEMERRLKSQDVVLGKIKRQQPGLFV